MPRRGLRPPSIIARGTLPYLAPEIVVALMDGKATQVFEKSVDIWGFGLGMFDVYEDELLTLAYFASPGAVS